MQPFVEMIKVSKSFPGVKALSDVSVEFFPGELHVLLGENGAGKSTLIKIISGVYVRDEGEVKVDGKTVNFTDTKQALHGGISVIHQELSVIPDLTVAENIFLGTEPHIPNTPFIDRKLLYKKAAELIEKVGVCIDPRAIVRRLNTADRQMVEIVRAVSQNSALVIMDEPTSSLSDKEVDALFRVIAKLKEQNVAIIYISHRLKEIFQIGDKVTILRDGTKVTTKLLSETNEKEMISLMVGREMTQYYFKSKRPPSKEVVLCVQNLCGSKFADVSFDLHKGEILGIAGLIGSGRTEVMRAIFGADKVKSGDIHLFGKKVQFKHPLRAIQAGMGLIPEDRRNQGLLLSKSVKENTSLASLYANSHNGFIDFAWEKAIAQDYVQKLKTKTPGIETRTKNLSGGNQQKVVIAKWLSAKSKILIMDEPTRGIDVNAKAEIYSLMQGFIEDGGSIIMVSSELPEILGVSNRILVMREGKISGILSDSQASEESIMQLASLN